MTQQAAAGVPRHGAAIQILGVSGELGLATADRLAARGRATLARRARVLLLDLTGLTFSGAHGLSAFVKIANHAGKTGCRYGLIAPPPQVAKLLRITRLDQRLPVFAAIHDALAHLTATASAAPAMVT